MYISPDIGESFRIILRIKVAFMAEEKRRKRNSFLESLRERRTEKCIAEQMNGAMENDLNRINCCDYSGMNFRNVKEYLRRYHLETFPERTEERAVSSEMTADQEREREDRNGLLRTSPVSQEGKICFDEEVMERIHPGYETEYRKMLEQEKEGDQDRLRLELFLADLVKNATETQYHDIKMKTDALRAEAIRTYPKNRKTEISFTVPLNNADITAEEIREIDGQCQKYRYSLYYLSRKIGDLGSGRYVEAELMPEGTALLKCQYGMLKNLCDMDQIRTTLVAYSAQTGEEYKIPCIYRYAEYNFSDVNVVRLGVKCVSRVDAGK